MKFLIFYKKVKLGVLEVNENGQHKYTPDIEKTKMIQKVTPLSHDLTEEKDWGEPIPFFKNRIENASRFDDLDVIETHTDGFVMIREDE